MILDGLRLCATFLNARRLQRCTRHYSSEEESYYSSEEEAEEAEEAEEEEATTEETFAKASVALLGLNALTLSN